MSNSTFFWFSLVPTNTTHRICNTFKISVNQSLCLSNAKLISKTRHWNQISNPTKIHELIASPASPQQKNTKIVFDKYLQSWHATIYFETQLLIYVEICYDYDHVHMVLDDKTRFSLAFHFSFFVLFYIMFLRFCLFLSLYCRLEICFRSKPLRFTVLKKVCDCRVLRRFFSVWFFSWMRRN